MNPDWNSSSHMCQHAQFKKAMMITEEELIWKLKDLTQSRLPAYEVVRKAWDSRKEFHESGEIILLEKFAPWKGNLVEIEREFNMEGQIKFAIFAD